MSDDFINGLNQIFTQAGAIARFFGALTLGGVAGWLTIQTFLEAEKRWQLQIAVFLGLLGAFVALNKYSGPGTVGAFALGTGIGALVIGIRNIQVSKKPESDKKSK